MEFELSGRTLSLTESTMTGRREINEDSYGWMLIRGGTVEGSNIGDLSEAPDGKDALILAVCDGMGGLDAGEVASSTAVAGMMEWAATAPRENLDEMLASLLNGGLEAVEARVAERCPKGGTTLSLVIGMDGRWASVHLGDSRCYAIQEDGRVFRTLDQSPVESMRIAGTITEDEMEVHPMRNLINCYLGGGHSDKAEAEDIPPWEVLVLCTDGASGSMPRGDFQDLIRGADAPDIVQECYARGSGDNITVLRLEDKEDPGCRGTASRGPSKGITSPTAAGGIPRPGGPAASTRSRRTGRPMR